MPETYDAVIVGAGLNGLVCAAYLGRAGLRVLVVERRKEVGGTASTIEFAPGFRASVGFDRAGPLLDRIVDELDLAAHGLELLRLDPGVVVLGEDGRSLALWRDAERTLGEIGQHSAVDAKVYPRFAETLGELAAFLRPVLTRPVPEPELRSAGDLLELFRLGWGLRQLGAERMRELLRILPTSLCALLLSAFCAS